MLSGMWEGIFLKKQPERLKGSSCGVSHEAWLLQRLFHRAKREN